MLTQVARTLSLFRKAKSEAKVGMRTTIKTASVSGTPETIAYLRGAEGDLLAAGRVMDLEYVQADDFSVDRIELEEAQAGSAEPNLRQSRA